MEILVKEKTNVSRASKTVRHRNLSDVDVLVEVDGVPHVQYEPEYAVRQGHVRYQRIGRVAELSLPLRTVDPTEPCINEHPESAGMAHGMVLFAQVWEIHVAESICRIEHDLERAVADDQIAGHVWRLPSSHLSATRRKQRRQPGRHAGRPCAMNPCPGAVRVGGAMSPPSRGWTRMGWIIHRSIPVRDGEYGKSEKPRQGPTPAVTAGPAQPVNGS